jgi:hypothetical protein
LSSQTTDTRYSSPRTRTPLAAFVSVSPVDILFGRLRVPHAFHLSLARYIYSIELALEYRREYSFVPRSCSCAIFQHETNFLRVSVCDLVYLRAYRKIAYGSLEGFVNQARRRVSASPERLTAQWHTSPCYINYVFLILIAIGLTKKGTKNGPKGGSS